MSLWEQARNIFVEQLRAANEDSSNIDRFLRDKASLEDARQGAESLREDSDRKYGINESRGGKGVSAKWIRRIMENLNQITTIGNVAMIAAPESIGIVWFAVEKVLSAVQNDYSLYGTFNTALNDITEMMVLVQTYDKLYQDRTKQADGSIYQELFKGIVDIYVSILDFSYAVRKHISGGRRSKLKHAFKDVVGADNRSFEAKSTALQAQKTKVVEYAQAAFQHRTSGNLQGVSENVVAMQHDLLDFHRQSSKDQKEIMSELKATNKTPSHRELAVAEYEKNMQRLTPWLDTSDSTLEAHVKEHEAGTCAWIKETPAYSDWYNGKKNSILCVTGEAGSGKSVLGAFVYQMLCDEADEHEPRLVQYISQDIRSTEDKSKAPKKIENTLIRGMYQHALDDKEDDLLLQRCNGIFARPRKSRGKNTLDRNNVDRSIRGAAGSNDSAPELTDVYRDLVEALEKRVVLVVDAVDELPEADQARLAENLVGLTKSPEIRIRILLLCRPSTPMRFKLGDESVTQLSVVEHNGGDIKLLIEKGLQILPSLSAIERVEVADAITHKTGHRIRYVQQVAVPFLQTPFQRPVTTWLKSLPENVNETYHQHLHQLAPAYHDLLRLILGLTFVSEGPLTVEEIMDAYSRVYVNGSTGDGQSIEDPNVQLYRDQIQTAGGPFVDIQHDTTVVLADPQAVRDFCSPTRVGQDEAIDERSLCAKCKNSMLTMKTLAIPEKEEHLRLAIICMKHLNSPAFHARFFAPSLDEAKNRAQKSSTANACEETDRTNHDHVLVPPEESTATPEHEATLKPEAQQGTSEKQSSAESPAVEADDDDSVFSDEEDEDENIEQPTDDGDWDDKYQHSIWRYEVRSWEFNVREAERLWPPEERETSPQWQELLSEFERFFILEPVSFEAWKLDYVNYRCESWQPLHFASRFGLETLARFLLDKGAKVMDLTPVDSWSALHLASSAPKATKLGMLRLLLSHGGDPNLDESTDVSPPFHCWLSDEDDPDCVRELLRSNALCSLLDKASQWNVLHHYAWRGSEKEVLKLLLENPLDVNNRADINVRDGDGETPLHKLLGRQKIPLELLKEFLMRGADVDIDDKSSERPLYEAASWGENAAVEAIIDRVADVDDESTWGRTALHGAAWSGHKETVEILLQHGAAVNRKDKHNRTPLLLACLANLRRFSAGDAHRATAEMLIEEQVKQGTPFEEINACTKRGRTPLREAAGRGFSRVVDIILHQMKPKDTDCLNKRDDRKGRTPLHTAAAHGRGDVIALLLQHDADISLREGLDFKGMTSLELCLDKWAIVGSQHYEDAISLLIDACANEAKENKLLITTAAIQGSVKVLERLAKVGVNLDLPDDYGWTPTQLASQFGHTEAAAFIKDSLAKQALRPRRWTLSGDSKLTSLQDDGQRINHEGDLRFCILADHPVPAGLSTYYYEVEILDPTTGEPKDNSTKGDEKMPFFALGFSTSFAKYVDFPGWPPRSIAPNVQSWGYHGDDGAFYASNEKKWPLTYGDHYGPGDTVGCGLDVDERTIFFTRNGARINDHMFQGFNGRVFPILGLSDKVKLRTNFGINPNLRFKWDQQAGYAEEKQQEPGQKLVNGT